MNIDPLISCYLVEVQNAKGTKRMLWAQETQYGGREHKRRLKQEQHA
jgi:hypothetical protein